MDKGHRRNLCTQQPSLKEKLEFLYLYESREHGFTFVTDRGLRSCYARTLYVFQQKRKFPIFLAFIHAARKVEVAFLWTRKS